MNALDPIRHAYGEAEGTPPTPGEQGYPEYRLLRSTRAVLDGLPRERPDAAALDALRATAEAHALQPLLAAYGEAEPPAPGTRPHAEYALLDGTREVLSRAPKARPDAAVLAAVAAAAHEASALGPLRHAYGEAEGAPPAPGDPTYAEYALLRSTRAALDALPRQRPDAEVLDALRAAAEAHALQPLLAAYGEAEPPAPGTRPHAEYALLDGTREVLSRAPRARPDAAVLAALTVAVAEAAEATPAVPDAPARPARRPAGPSPAADRPSQDRARALRHLPAWIGTAAMLVIVATVGLWVLNEQPPRIAAPERAQAQQDAAPSEGQAAPDVPADVALPPTLPAQPDEVAEARPPSAASSSGQGAGTRNPPEATPLPPAAATPRVTPPAPARPTPARPSAVSPSAAPREIARMGLAAEGAVPSVATWEAGEDVRLLSLRLRQIAETNEGLSWDVPPRPFGATTPGTPGSRLEGVSPVGDGPSPARIEVRMRTAPADRSDGQQPRR